MVDVKFIKESIGRGQISKFSLGKVENWKMSVFFFFNRKKKPMILKISNYGKRRPKSRENEWCKAQKTYGPFPRFLGLIFRNFFGFTDLIS